MSAPSVAGRDSKRIYHLAWVLRQHSFAEPLLLLLRSLRLGNLYESNDGVLFAFFAVVATTAGVNSAIIVQQCKCS